MPNFVSEFKGDGVTRDHPYDLTPGEHSVFLQCSVPSDFENTTSLDGTKGRCCGLGSAQLVFSFHCRNNVEAFENDLKVFSSWGSGKSVFKDISSSESLCCSAVKCEEIFGNCSQPECEGKGQFLHSTSCISNLH